MTPEQESHLETIKGNFSRLVDAKYRKGQAEHGGNLFDLGIELLVDAAIDEAVDQIVYLLTLRDELRQRGSIVAKVEHENKTADISYDCVMCGKFLESKSIYIKHAIDEHGAIYNNMENALTYRQGQYEVLGK